MSARAWLIPAHAGKTRRVGGLSLRRGAHPRSRGENLQHDGNFRQEGGSSPLTRGKPCGAALADLRVGLIPAHAGKTSCGMHTTV